jgi:hypothetical protein
MPHTGGGRSLTLRATMAALTSLVRWPTAVQGLTTCSVASCPASDVLSLAVHLGIVRAVARGCLDHGAPLTCTS